MLLTQADGDSPEFNAFATALGKRLFPQYQWSDLPPDHPVFNISYRITDRPDLRVITNGSRILMMNLPKDISKHWELREEKDAPSSFEFGVNLVLYASGRTQMRNRLNSTYIPDAATPPPASMRVAHLRYDGNWDPEPAALPKAAREFRDLTSLGVNVEMTNIVDLPASNPPMAFLTGTARFHPTLPQVQAIQQYVQNGGVLVIDPCGVPGDFLQSIKDDLLTRAFPDQRPGPMPQTHPMVTPSNDGMADVSTPVIREFARSYPGIEHTLPQMMKVGKGHVIVMSLDLGSGLLGAGDWGIASYDSDYAPQLFKNMVLWTWDGQRD
jgi:hypothetical protein